MSTQPPPASTVSVELDAHGSGALHAGGDVHRWNSRDLAAARKHAVTLLVAQAGTGALYATVDEPSRSFQLRVSPEGGVEHVGSAITAAVPSPRVLHASGRAPQTPATAVAPPAPPAPARIEPAAPAMSLPVEPAAEAPAAEIPARDAEVPVAPVPDDADSTTGVDEDEPAFGPVAAAPVAARRRWPRFAAAGVVVAVVAAGSGAAWLSRDAPAPLAVNAASRAQWAADLNERRWLDERRTVVANARVAQQRAAEVAGAQAAVEAARGVLTASAQADVGLREALSVLVEQAGAQLAAGAAPASWEALVRQLPAAMQAVADSQTQWQAAEDARVAAEQAAAEQAAAAERAAAAQQAPAGGRAAGPQEGSSTPAPSGQSGGTAGSGAPPAATHKEIKPGAISTGTGWAQASATTQGITGAVYLNIAGRSVYMGTGSGTFTARVDGLAAGTYAWSVSADELVASGSKNVAVG
ncbi:hypothetical protein [Cellulomonas hominis]|uniref:hypothetical protein n=1 Tax=Cellulomonas hominis TaxID=156981 RepID=UPI001BA34103|nr:hypothetical protein [Cellulomonas hominis]VTR76029.1 hypothetical protein CHMI_00785 [Cellulomonas hominis]